MHHGCSSLLDEFCASENFRRLGNRPAFCFSVFGVTVSFVQRSPPLHAGADFSALYADLLPICRDVAWLHGYCLAVHGTMRRDMDVIAVPWVVACSDPVALILAVADACGGIVDLGQVHHRSHGRLSCSIVLVHRRHPSLKRCSPWIDLSVMPPMILSSAG